MILNDGLLRLLGLDCLMRHIQASFPQNPQDLIFVLFLRS